MGIPKGDPAAGLDPSRRNLDERGPIRVVEGRVALIPYQEEGNEYYSLILRS